MKKCLIYKGVVSGLLVGALVVMVPPIDVRAERTADTKDQTQVDNTGINKRDRAENSKTSDSQNMDREDTELIAKVRRAIVDNDKLSLDAQNIKIMAENGKVTLRGPVDTAKEKTVVGNLAKQIAGMENVDNKLEVKQAS